MSAEVCTVSQWTSAVVDYKENLIIKSIPKITCILLEQ